MRTRVLFFLSGVLALASCGTPTANLVTIVQHRSAWDAQRPADYEFDYQFQAGFPPNFGCPTTAFHVVVRDTTVVSAACRDGGQPVMGLTVTVDRIYADALKALGDGTLKEIDYSADFDYPTRVVLASLPDGMSSEEASNLRAVYLPVAP